MEAFSKLVKLHQILRARRGPISVYSLQDRLECSRPTLYRVMGRLRDDLGAPIVNVRGEGYRYDRSNGDFELPGLWLNAEELHALLTMDALLQQIQPGVLKDVVGPIRERVEKLLGEAGSKRAVTAARVRECVQVTPVAARTVDARLFGEIATATLERRRLRMTYHGRARDASSEREVSPLRLRYYRDNWYLDGWCHAERRGCGGSRWTG
jgi:proteasome accessory factor C